MFLRPRAIFDHPKLGRVVSQFWGIEGEKLFIHRADALGFEVRTLVRVVIGWTDRGILYLAQGPFDTRAVTNAMWDRLVLPRQRTVDDAGNEHVAGMLAEHPIALLMQPRCGTAAFGEYGEVLTVNAVLRESEGEDPDVLMLWKGSPRAIWNDARMPSLVGPNVRAVEFRATAEESGVGVTFTFVGAVPDDFEARVENAAVEFRGSSLGGLTGAAAWLVHEALTWRRERDRTSVSLVIPWSAVQALGRAWSGQITGPPPT